MFVLHWQDRVYLKYSYVILFYEAGVDDNSWDTANTDEEEETASVSTETESEQDSTGIKSVLRPST